MKAADLFCGAGGTSTGMVKAARRRGLALYLVAVEPAEALCGAIMDGAAGTPR